MSQITTAMLQHKIDTLNTLTNSPTKPYMQIEGRSVAQIGNFNLYSAYGAYGLHRICNEGGGVTAPIYGLYTKRDLYAQLVSMIYGIELERAAK